MIQEFTDEELKTIKKFRNTEMYKLDCQSDFKTLRQCFKVCKELYNALKYFDSRVTRFQCFNNFEQKNYASKRRYTYPSEYYSFRFFDVEISIQLDRRRHEYFISTTGFYPKTFTRENNLGSDSTYYELARYGSTPHLSEAIVEFDKIVFEFLDGAYSLGL